MTLLDHTITPTLHLQWQGTAPPFFAATNKGGFVGIEVPPLLERTMVEMGKTPIPADPGNLVATCKAELVRRFEQAALASPVPEGTAQLTLMGDPIRTDLMVPEKWKPSLNGPALAFQVGIRELAPDRTPDRLGAVSPYERSHAGGLVTSTYWACFELTQGGTP